MYQETNLMNPRTVASLIESYLTAQNEVADAFGLLENAKTRLRAAFGEHACSVFPDRCRDYNLPETAKETREQIKRQTWYSILQRCQIENLLSSARKDELHREIKEGKIPDLTPESLIEFVQNLRAMIPDLLTETIKEAFEILRPRHSKHKTNTEYEIGPKVILGWMVELDWNHLVYRAEDKLRSVDNAFHLMDGKGPVKYPGDAVTTIRTAMQNKLRKAETEYFAFEWFKNGNLHITFKRLDLVKELNKRAGGNRLPKGKEENTNE